MTSLITTYIIIENGERSNIWGGVVSSSQVAAVETFIKDTELPAARFTAYDVEFNVGELSDFDAWELDCLIHETQSSHEGVKQFQARRGQSFNINNN